MQLAGDFQGPHAYHCLRAYGYLVQCYISLILELADHSTHGEQTGCFSSQLYDLYLIGAMLLLTSFMCLFFIYSAWLTSSQRIRRLLRFSCTIPPTTRFRLFGACCLLLTLWCYVFWNVNCQGDANEESLYKKKKNTQGLIKAASGGMGCGSYKRANKPGESCLVHNIKQQKGSKTFKLRTEKQQFQNICYFIIG
uniref:Uncharacterized protein LOC105040004 isoform X4 n=1 Tax=Elaeis guineensis var. tenera TaxID=51953 RepID=A0A6J0PH22_ELAGV|nr:uncharacterized protein LOC105040004 isoform X4 [Elaeis guineensis]